MTNTNQIKRALLSSVLALVLCFTMLLGTTFAWFTDSVTSSGNKIVAGELNVELLIYDAQQDAYVDIANSQNPIFGPGSIAQNNAGETLWEPGKTQTVYLAIKNAGTLALKYQVALEVYDVEENLHEAMSYIISPDKQAGSLARGDLDFANYGVRVNEGINATQALDVAMLPGDIHYFAISIHMDETAGNEYMNGSITFDLRVLATQLAHEEDSFGPEYDENAPYPGGVAAAEVNRNGATYILVTDDKTNESVLALNIPADAVADNVANIVAEVEEDPNYVPNFSYTAGMTTQTFNITVSGIKEGNTANIPVELHVPAGLADVKIYHYDQEITNAYDNADRGIIYFNTTSFSPFTIVYDANSEYVPPVEFPEGLPQADVVYAGEHVGVDIAWGEYGQWSPTEGLDSQLEAAYKFSCLESAEEAANSPYANWYCDFVVVLDKELGANEIFLGGNYGSFGWVGFHNGDLTLAANEEVYLLGSVTSSPWTYGQVAEFVGEFTCGVGDVNNALADKGATFKVMLRLTNPENENEFYNIETITYTFQ